MTAKHYYKSTRMVETRNWTLEMVINFAEEYAEVLRKHDVIKSICEKCGSKSFVHSKKQNKEICLDCWENEQTVL